MKASSKRREKEFRVECPNCGEPKWVRDYQHNELICANCGLILREGIKDTGPEWTAYSIETLTEINPEKGT